MSGATIKSKQYGKMPFGEWWILNAHAKNPADREKLGAMQQSIRDRYTGTGRRVSVNSGAGAPAPPPSKEALLTKQTGESTAYRKRRLAYGRKSTLG